MSAACAANAGGDACIRLTKEINAYRPPLSLALGTRHLALHLLALPLLLPLDSLPPLLLQRRELLVAESDEAGACQMLRLF